MMNVDSHRMVFVNILREIYSDSLLRTKLGFKGGSAAMFFYGLPRFSVDLDFDLLAPDQKDEVLGKLKNSLSRFGNLVEALEKKYTLFFLLDYGKGERNMKIEISKRPEKSKFVPRDYLGITMLVMTEADMAAGKLAALLTRKRFATRDVFDVWYFLKSGWPINEKFLYEKSGMTLATALKKTQVRVKKIKKTELLAGLGELLDNKQKAWVKEKLIEEVLFQLRLRQKFLS